MTTPVAEPTLALGGAQSRTHSALWPEVVIVQQVLKQYRLAFFDQLAAMLAAQQIRLTVLFGVATGIEASKGDNITEAPALHYQPVRVRCFGPLVWQWHPVLQRASVVVVEQANRHLLNYWLARCRRQQHFRLVFWGHGYDHQAQHPLRARWKRYQLRQCDHFMAYTGAVAEWLQQHGLPAAGISVLNNSLDTSALQAIDRSGQETSVRPLVILYSGALYPAKQLPLLLQTCERLYQAGLMSRLTVIGDGPLRPFLQQWAERTCWLDYRGACFAEDKTQAYQDADLVLNPGLTGLAILDAFAAGLPYLTTIQPNHSPEIHYLQQSVNGYMVPADALSLFSAVQLLHQDPALRCQLGRQARSTARQFSLAAMVRSAAEAIVGQLAQRRERQLRQLHQAYRQAGGEEQVVEREQALFAAHQLRLQSVLRQTPAQLSLLQRGKAVAAWFGVPGAVDVSPLQGLTRGDVLIVHNLFPLLTPFLLRAARQRGIRTMVYLHNFRPLTPAAVLAPDQQAKAPDWTQVWAQRTYPGRPEGAILSTVLAVALWWQYRCRLWQQADLLICPSHFVRQQYLAAGFDGANMVVKPHYVPAVAPAAAATAPGCRQTLLYVGRSGVEKGLAFLLDCWRDWPDAPQLLLAGPAPADLSLPPQVQALGLLDQATLAQCYQQTALVLVPSLVAETFGNVVIEAYAQARPVLAAKSGALTELVDDGVTGMLFQAGGRDELRCKVRELLQQPELRAEMERQAKARYLAQFSPAAQWAYYQQWFAEGSPLL